MSTVAALPPAMRERLLTLARRIRLLRAVRGSSLLLLAVTLTGGAALLLDAWLDLPALARGMLLAGLLLLAGYVAFITLLRPLLGALRPEALAAIIEERYPDLGERLTSSVELAGEPELAHGSPALIALLLQETEARTNRLNILLAFPGRLAALLAAVAGLVLLVAASPALLWPERYAELGRRFLTPWRSTETVVPYRLEVQPGSAFAARGRPFTVAVRVQPIDANNPNLPRTSTLVCTDGHGKVRRLPMQVERADAFTVHLDAVAGDFTYHVEAGDAASDAYQVTAVEPADLTADSLTITITPPAYACEVLEPETVQGVADLSALQHSRLRLECGFTRSVLAARLEWAPPGTPKEKPSSQPLELAPDRQSGQVELPALNSGSWKLVLEVEHGIRTEVGPRLLTVQIDQPPAFLKVAGLTPADAAAKAGADRSREDLRMVLPYDTVPLDLTVADDIAVSQAHVEFRVNDSAPSLEAIPLPKAGGREVTTRHLFKLAERALKEGDVLRYRLKAIDNRNVPEAKLGPNVVYHPADRWLTLKVAQNAQPLRQQEITAQRDDLNQRLEAIKKDLLKEQRGLYKLREESRNQSTLTPAQNKDLKGLRKENRASENALRELAREASETPALQPLADRAQDVADREMRNSDKALQAGEKESRPAIREDRLREADANLTGALQRLDELRRANERLAQERLDQMRLEMLAERQQQLAEQTAERAQGDPIKQPAKPSETEQLKRAQGELANDLQRLAEQSEALRTALDAARAEQAKQMAEKARELAKSQRELSDVARESQKGATETKLAELARRQEQLADQAAGLAKETRQPAQTARTAPLKAEEPRKAAEALKHGDAGVALRHQNEAARDLERLAGDLEQALELARDPREAARQLARLQEGLRQQLQEKVKTQDPNVPLAGQLQELQREQEALRRATQDLPVPAQQKPAREAQQQAMDRSRQAARALYKPNAREAEAEMAEARSALERLAERLPSLEQRQRQAREEVARLRRHQEEIARQAEKATKPDAKPEQTAQQLAEAARRQAESAERLDKLDAPGQQALQQLAREAANRALAALKEPKSEDLAATQQEARRQLERLEQGLAGKQDVAQPPAGRPSSEEMTPPQGLPRRDQAEQARQLAQEQRRLRDEVQRLALPPTPTNPVGPLAAQQQEIAQRTNELARNVGKEQGKQAPSTQQAQQAARSAQQAAGQLQAGALPQAQKTGEQTAQQLRQLAQQLSQTPRGQGEPAAADPVQAARDLAQQQEDLNRRLAPLAQDTKAQQGQQVGQQGQLHKQTDQLVQELKGLAQKMGRTPEALQPAQQAINSGRQARSSMQQAQNQQREGNRGQTQQSQQQAAQQLDQAAQQLEQAAQQLTRGQSEPRQSAGQSVQQAQGEMRQAESQLGRNQSQGAQAAMQRAADALQQAAQQLGQQQQQPGQPALPQQPPQLGAAGGGVPDLSGFGEEMKKYAGKRWGELPGELRTKIIQDMKARYGDDYARIIKLYFEQIADTKNRGQGSGVKGQ